MNVCEWVDVTCSVKVLGVVKNTRKELYKYSLSTINIPVSVTDYTHTHTHTHTQVKLSFPVEGITSSPDALIYRLLNV